MSKDESTMWDGLKDCETPFDALTLLMGKSPDGIKDYVNGRVQEILLVDLPKLHVLIQEGPACPASNAPEVAKLFKQSIEHMQECHPETYRKDMTATIQDCAIQIAELIDASVKRILLDDKYANRMAAINLCAEHAKLVKCFIDIALTPDQLDEYTASRKESSGASDSD